MSLRQHGLFCCALLLAGCASTPRPAPTLYDQLGGQAGLEALVETLLSHVADDPRINQMFARVNIVMLNQHLNEKLCQVSDGPCHYRGKAMGPAHAHLPIGQGQFNALVEDLIWAMDQQKIPRTTQNRLIKRLAPMQGEIVNQ